MLIYQNSASGKAALARVNALAQKKDAEVGERVKAMQAAQQKLQSGEGVLSDSARAQLEKEITAMQRDGERFQQDAEAEVGQLNQEVQSEFYQKLYPVLVALSKEKSIQVLFSGQSPAGVPPAVIWFEPGLDLTAEAIKRLDAAAPAAAAPAAAAPAPAKPPAPSTTAP
jgi:Skp family chaperone for outer membrane proteins